MKYNINSYIKIEYINFINFNKKTIKKEGFFRFLENKECKVVQSG